ncbi:hypothetical protein BDZ97DRAFT_1763210 [Flammula alnicola]|nr:hypothetical protein BDZ97DRAFT_1763210 [Flammula alnicola]
MKITLDLSSRVSELQERLRQCRLTLLFFMVSAYNYANLFHRPGQQAEVRFPRTLRHPYLFPPSLNLPQTFHVWISKMKDNSTLIGTALECNYRPTISTISDGLGANQFIDDRPPPLFGHAAVDIVPRLSLLSASSISPEPRFFWSDSGNVTMHDQKVDPLHQSGTTAP